MCLYLVLLELFSYLLPSSFNNRAEHTSEGQRGYEEEKETVWEEK